MLTQYVRLALRGRMMEANIRSGMPVTLVRATTQNTLLRCNMSVSSVYDTTYSLIERPRIR